MSVYMYIQVRQLEEASSQPTVFDPTPGTGGGGRRAHGGLTGAAEEEAQAPNTVDSAAQMRLIYSNSACVIYS